MRNKLLILAILISSIGYGQFDTIQVDTIHTYVAPPVLSTKWAVMDISDYYSFNCEISEAKGYIIGMSTERVFKMNPSHYCLVDSVLMTAVAINPENQKYYSGEFFERSEINFKDTILEDIELIDQKTFDWTSRHLEKTGKAKNKRWIFINGRIEKEKVPKKIN